MFNPPEYGLATERDVVNEAIASAEYFFHSTVRTAKQCTVQGESSRTVEIHFRNQSYVVQLRSKSVNEENARIAQCILGDTVPVPMSINRQGSDIPYTYVLPQTMGSTWYERDITDWGPKEHVKVARQIGAMIGACCGEFLSSAVVDTFVIPRLRRYLESEDDAIRSHEPLIRDRLQRVDALRKLPLCWTHWDINHMNIMVTTDARISGILDWEVANWSPFGMNTCSISELAAYNKKGVLSKRPYSEQLERAFWQGVFRTAPTAVRHMLPEIQLAKDIGMIITTFTEGDRAPVPAQSAVLDDSIELYRVPEDLSTLVCPEGQHT